MLACAGGGGGEGGADPFLHVLGSAPSTAAAPPLPSAAPPLPTAAPPLPVTAPPLHSGLPPPPPLPEGWEAAWSEDDKDYYFYREDTGEVTWDVPLT